MYSNSKFKISIGHLMNGPLIPYMVSMMPEIIVFVSGILKKDLLVVTSNSLLSLL